MRRFDDWPTRLNAAIAAPFSFQWGKTDCALRACHVAQAITGVDLAERYAGRYSTPLGAARVIRRAGFDTLAELVADALPEIPTARARRGDLVVIDTQDGDALGVAMPPHCLAAGPNAWRVLPLGAAVRAFKIG